MTRLDDLPHVLLIGPFPASWPVGITGDVPLRRTADAAEALASVASGWPDVIVVDAATPTRELRELLAGHETPVLEVVEPGSPGRRVAPIVDVVVEPVPAEVLWRRARRTHELARLRRAMAGQRRLETSGVLMASLAHEIRNPVHALAQGLGALRRLLPPDLETRTSRLMEVLEQAGSRLVSILQEVGGPDVPSTPGTWDAAQGIARALALLEHRTRAVEIRVEASAAPPVTGHPQQLDQVVTNLLDNAIRAAGEGGWVEVAVHTADDVVQIEVRDSGPGIDGGRLEEIFEPYVTTYAGRGGTGLGLHLCRSIVESHHGRLWATSEPGQGAVFTLRLPLTPQLTGRMA